MAIDPWPPKTPFFKWCVRNPMEVILCFLVIILNIVVFLQVFYRYALQSPLPWSEELAMFLFQWTGFVGAGVAVRRQTHYTLDLVTKRLSPRKRNVTHILGSLMIFITAFIMFYIGWDMVNLTMGQEYAGLRVPVGYAYVAIVLSGLMMFIFQIPIFINQIQELKAKVEP